MEQRLLHPFLEITERAGLDREAAGAAVSALEFAPSRCPVGSWNDLEMAAYAFSKVGLNTFTAELARQWPGVRINALGALHRRKATLKVLLPPLTTLSLAEQRYDGGPQSRAWWPPPCWLM